MPAGDTKYILALFIDGQRKGYLSRGFIRLQVQAFWGTTGIIMYRVEKDDVITIEYVIKLGANVVLNGNYINIGITKL
mgnify:CR=1 FL=1